MTDLTSAVAWLIKVDGLHSQGYCPTPSSGLNIGLDIDFSQQNSDADFKSHYTPDCLLARLRPFYGALCSDSCYNPDSPGSFRLSLTTEEVTVLSTGFTVTNVQAVASYGNHKRVGMSWPLWITGLGARATQIHVHLHSVKQTRSCVFPMMERCRTCSVLLSNRASQTTFS